MQDNQHVEVNIPSNPIFERVVRASAAEIGEALDFPEDRIEDLKLAVSEAVTNAIEHGNQNMIHKLVEIVFALDQEKLEVRITDQGSGIGEMILPSEVVMITEQTLDERTGGGFGLSLIKAMVDDCEVQSSNRGTIIILRLYRKGQEQ
ncbi:MAG: ATP-binding protein [Chloroflexaceae bacterium]|nr:ATP-binding protein [Chloroflexaceae bacterium]